MSEEKTEVALVTLPSVPAELEAAFIDEKFIDSLIENVRTKSLAVVGDLNTTKGRKTYISMSANVRSTKAMIEEAGKTLVAEIKKRPAMIDAGRKKIREALDELAVEIRKPVTDWEIEQERLAAEKQMQDWHLEALELNEAFNKERAERFETDHEVALLWNEKFDRDAADAKVEAERLRIAHEEELKRLAENAARRALEQEVQRERDEAAHREAVLKAQAERAEREKQEAIAAEQLKAQQEAERIQREAKQKEDARLAEEKRVADEAAARAADVAHRKTIGTAIVNALTSHAGLTREQAIATLTALKDGNIPHTSIQY